MQEVPPAEPVEEGDEGEWDTVREPAGSRSPAPTVKELIAPTVEDTTINIDANTLVRQCEACQKTANQQNLPSMPVHLIPPTWPLQRWGMDLVGPLPTTKGNCRFAAVAVDYFTKWVEAKPLANIKATKIQKFFWQNIVCKFGVPRELTVDNGKQFDCYTFKEYCKTLGTLAKFSSVYHPQSNGAVERANGLIFRESRNACSTRRRENG
jgi:transposase InsO family protein